MCGICGIYDTGADVQPVSRLETMVSSIVHRGPDAGGTFIDGGVGLGHRRLKIIDLSQAGSQPMSFGAATIVYNGESYNFQSLRRELIALGHEFRGHSDTEVVLHAYDEWGMKGLDRLEGMFALALWDARQRKLILMRDRLGIKPLFYTWQDGRLVFGSEIKAVLAGGEPSRDIDQQGLAEYLWYGNTFEDRTIYRYVHSLKPGYRLVVEGGSLTVAPYWTIEEWLQNPERPTDSEESTAAVREALDASVKRQLVSDVPICLFLSGGVDSSAIAAAATAAGGARLTSYAVGFDFAGGVNELPKARSVAEALNLDHHELHISGASVADVVESLVDFHDEPFADAANIPLFLLARELSGSVKVALQGDGGDEMFAGYRRYALLRNAKLWRCWPQFLGIALRRLPGRAGRRLARLGAAAGNGDAAMRMALLLTMESLAEPPEEVFEPEARRRLEQETDPFLAYRHCAKRFSGHDAVQQMLLTDIQLQLPSQFLPKVDRATMAHGLETRVPLLDDRLASVAVGLPSAFKVNRHEKKIILRNAVRDRLPKHIIDGPKTGFGVPYGAWLRGALHELARDALLDTPFVDRFHLRRSALTSMLDDHRAERCDHGFRLWKLLNLSLWARKCL